jgi:hypothetical protein
MPLNNWHRLSLMIILVTIILDTIMGTTTERARLLTRETPRKTTMTTMERKWTPKVWRIKTLS